MTKETEHRGEKYRSTLTAAQFTKASKMTRMKVNTINMAREVMVDGERTVQVAKRYGAKRQAVTQSCKRIYESHLDLHEIPKDWVEVKVYLPSKKAKEVESLAKKLRADYLKNKQK